VLLDAYDEEEVTDVNGRAETRVVLRLHPRVAPYKAAVLPLMKKPELVAVARQVFDAVQDACGALVEYDETGNIGKRYRRQDEIGTPFCITVDYESLDDQKVTIRNRDDMSQQRLAIAAVPEWIGQQIR
jgi:glycyl-tRNA synthetase